MQAYILVFLGAGFGGALRHTVNLLAARLLGTNFPWGTFLINISGSLVMGLLAGFLAFRTGANWTQHARLFLLTGVLGGYTTFSAYSLDSALLLERGAYLMTAAYVGGSVFLALAGVFGGLFVARALS
jgi:fluoride exporter